MSISFVRKTRKREARHTVGQVTELVHVEAVEAGGEALDGAGDGAGSTRSLLLEGDLALDLSKPNKGGYGRLGAKAHAKSNANSNARTGVDLLANQGA